MTISTRIAITKKQEAAAAAAEATTRTITITTKTIERPQQTPNHVTNSSIHDSSMQTQLNAITPSAPASVTGARLRRKQPRTLQKGRPSSLAVSLTLPRRLRVVCPASRHSRSWTGHGSQTRGLSQEGRPWNCFPKGRCQERGPH